MRPPASPRPTCSREESGGEPATTATYPGYVIVMAFKEGLRILSTRALPGYAARPGTDGSNVVIRIPTDEDAGSYMAKPPPAADPPRAWSRPSKPH
jgi:hypothetical protein